MTAHNDEARFPRGHRSAATEAAEAQLAACAPDPHNVYLTWVVCAVCGKLPEADAIMRVHGDAVRAVAAGMRRFHPVPARTLYRGVLLTDADAAAGALAAEPGTQSTSFTEDASCAAWFACTEASIGGAVMEGKGAVSGYVMTHTPEPATILFHHSWRMIPTPHGMIPLRNAAMLAEADGAFPPTGACQFEWALRTQSEVILEAIREPIALRPVGPLDAARLEVKYGPPEVMYAVTRQPHVR